MYKEYTVPVSAILTERLLVQSGSLHLLASQATIVVMDAFKLVRVLL